MQMRLTILLLTSLLFTATASAQSWRMFTDPDEFFSVNFPAEPTVRNFEYASEYGATLPGKIYEVRNGDSLHSVTIVNFTDAQRIYQELPDRTDEGNNAALWLYDQRGSVAYAARNFRLRGGEVTYDAWHHIDLVEGHQLQMTNADQSRTYASMYLHDGRLYVLEATVPPGSLPQGLFQQSLSFLDAEGKRIRYRLSPDGSRTRVPPP
ncbi:MAG: hypothetical protein OEQ25_10700 [Gammaproteobacteria bacterium]|nr:hypothetical protein [Gammaproteobacteria bacterium]